MASIRKRVKSNGEVTYTAQVRVKGHPTECATFKRKTETDLWAKQTEADIRRGLYFKTSQAKRHTVGDAIDRYREEILRFRDNPANQLTYLKYWEKEIGAYSLSDATPDIISKARNKLMETKNKFGKTRGAATANRYAQALGHVFTIARKQWGWINDNPVANLDNLKEQRGRTRFLSDDERNRLLHSCKQSSNPYLYQIVVLALSTGARKSEIVNLKWSNIDFDRRKITLDKTKNGEQRSIPLQSIAYDLVKKCHSNRIVGCDYLFPSQKFKRDENGRVVYQPIDIRTAWENAVQNAGILDFRFHDLRHSAASYLAMNGATLSELAAVLGHKTLQMVKRYAHISEDHTAEIVQKMNQKIFGELNG